MYSVPGIVQAKQLHVRRASSLHHFRDGVQRYSGPFGKNARLQHPANFNMTMKCGIIIWSILQGGTQPGMTMSSSMSGHARSFR